MNGMWRMEPPNLHKFFDFLKVALCHCVVKGRESVGPGVGSWHFRKKCRGSESASGVQSTPVAEFDNRADFTETVAFF